MTLNSKKQLVEDRLYESNPNIPQKPPAYSENFKGLKPTKIEEFTSIKRIGLAKVIRRRVKYIRLEIKNGEIIVILPIRSNVNIEDIIKKHISWLEKKRTLLEEIKELSKQCQIFHHRDLNGIILSYVDKISKILNVRPTIVSLRKMKRVWGSCRADGRLVFNKLLKFLPFELIEYVVLHEMCHLKIKNHRKEFYNLVKTVCHDFKEKEKMLSVYKHKLTEFI